MGVCCVVPGQELMELSCPARHTLDNGADTEEVDHLTQQTTGPSGDAEESGIFESVASILSHIFTRVLKHSRDHLVCSSYDSVNSL